MRIRTVKPEFWTSEDVAALDWDTRLVFIGLWSYVDDNGVGRDNERLIVADLFPLEEDPRDALAKVSRALASLAEAGLAARYEVDGKRYLYITGWDNHQRIDRPGKPRYPLPTCDDALPIGGVATPSRQARDTLAPGTGEQGNRGTEEHQKTSSSGERAPRATATRLPDPFPLTDDLTAWARENCPDVPRTEHERFIDYWRGVGGAKGRKTDWPATWRNWMRRAQDDIAAGRRPAAAGRRSTTDERVDQARSLREWASALDEADPATARGPQLAEIEPPQAPAGAAGPPLRHLAAVTTLTIEGTPA